MCKQMVKTEYETYEGPHQHSRMALKHGWSLKHMSGWQFSYEIYGELSIPGLPSMGLTGECVWVFFFFFLGGDVCVCARI